MYRDDPLDDEFELRAIIGDPAADAIAADPSARGMEAALDVLRVLQGWADEDAIAAWFVRSQRRLDQRSPVEALAAGDYEDVEDAARAWIAAQA